MIDVYKVTIGSSDEHGICDLRVVHPEKGVDAALTARLTPGEPIACREASFPQFVAEIVSGDSEIAAGTAMIMVYCHATEFGALAALEADPQKLADRLYLRMQEKLANLTAQ